MSGDTRNELTKVLGRHDVLALAFGAMIGWGWVVLSGEMTARAGTIGSALAFVLGAVMVFLVGLTYAELTSSLSRAGGELASRTPASVPARPTCADGRSCSPTRPWSRSKSFPFLPSRGTSSPD